MRETDKETMIIHITDYRDIKRRYKDVKIYECKHEKKILHYSHAKI